MCKLAGGLCREGVWKEELGVIQSFYLQWGMVRTQMTIYIHQNHCHAGMAVYTGISSMLDAKSERS